MARSVLARFWETTDRRLCIVNNREALSLTLVESTDDALRHLITITSDGATRVKVHRNVADPQQSVAERRLNRVVLKLLWVRSHDKTPRNGPPKGTRGRSETSARICWVHAMSRHGDPERREDQLAASSLLRRESFRIGAQTSTRRSKVNGFASKGTFHECISE